LVPPQIMTPQIMPPLIMPRHEESRHVPFAPIRMFNLVADVESYPKFLPWCIGTRIRDRAQDRFLADMIIGFKMLRERYTSRVWLDHDTHTIRVEYLDGPFRHLHNQWIFRPTEDGGTDIFFLIEFEFRSRLLEGLMGKMFGEAVTVMVNAFEKRARELYGAA
jgi:coenzyme Q-binding protein COQ10